MTSTNALIMYSKSVTIKIKPGNIKFWNNAAEFSFPYKHMDYSNEDIFGNSKKSISASWKNLNKDSDDDIHKRAENIKDYDNLSTYDMVSVIYLLTYFIMWSIIVIIVFNYQTFFLIELPMLLIFKGVGKSPFLYLTMDVSPHLPPPVLQIIVNICQFY